MWPFNEHFEKQSPTTTMTDPVFGSIQYEYNVWATVPALESHGFRTVIVASEAGPSEQQQTFYRSISGRLPEIETLAKKFISNDPKKCIESKGLSIIAIYVGDNTQVQRAWLGVELTSEKGGDRHLVEFAQGIPFSYMYF